MKPITIQDIALLRDSAIREYIALPQNCRLPGMQRDLSEGEKRTVAFFVSTLNALSRLGLVKEGQFDETFLRTFVFHYGQNVLDEETEGVVPSTANRV